ncbi:MAG: hypothetical protein ATN31_07910 [Candidatus Epulonipiscioides saccharophilum]|nr:MAG: hypothetical protein ATN31_07910 [Epulopiscium sp. AS2M-Bin001]
MKKGLFLLLLTTLALTGCGGETEKVKAEYPERSINAIVPFGAGGGTDVWGRAIMDGMATELGVNIIVSNVTGGSAGSTGISRVWNAPHDGYTLACTSETPLTIPVMTAITQTSNDWIYFIAAGSPGVLMVNKNAEYTTMDEIMAQLKKEPQSISIAGTVGGLWFAQAKLFDTYGDMPFNWLPYDGSGAALKGAVSQEADCVVASAGEAKDFMRSGDLIPLAVMELEAWHMPTVGNIPSVTEYLPQLAEYLPLNQFLGFKVPADTDPEIVAKLEEAFQATMDSYAIEIFANEQLATIYNLTGEEAKKYATQLESNLCWILSDMGTTTFSPDERGISR